MIIDIILDLGLFAVRRGPAAAAEEAAEALSQGPVVHVPLLVAVRALPVGDGRDEVAAEITRVVEVFAQVSAQLAQLAVVSAVVAPPRELGSFKI